MRTSIAGLATAGLSLFAATVLLVAPFAPAAVDDLRVRQLENEVMRLQRELDAQSRRIEDLERSQRSSSVGRPVAAPMERPTDSSPAWLISTNWDRVKPGMKDLEVIALLGRPNSVRTEPDGKARTLLYALELGPTAVLAGNVRMGDNGVAEINRPLLK
jgi:hypothetical protein